MVKVSSEDSLQVETTITKHFGWKFRILSNSNRESRENSSKEILLLAELFRIQCFNITKQVAQFLWDKLTSFPYDSFPGMSPGILSPVCSLSTLLNRRNIYAFPRKMFLNVINSEHSSKLLLKLPVSFFLNQLDVTIWHIPHTGVHRLWKNLIMNCSSPT